MKMHVQPVVGWRVAGGLVVLAVFHVRQLLRRAVLAPRHRLVAVEDQRCMGTALLDVRALETSGCPRIPARVRVRPDEPDAPAAPEDAVVLLHQRRERVPRLRRERPDREVVRHGDSLDSRLLSGVSFSSQSRRGYRRRRRLPERFPHPLAGERGVGVPVQLAHEFAAVLVAEVERDIARVEFEHVPRVPAEVVARRRVEVDVAEAGGAADTVPVVCERDDGR